MKPMYPEILTPDNTLQIIDNGDGTITVADNQEFLIQDVKLNTDQWPATERTFTLDPAKTYHLRFSLNGRAINSFTPQLLKFYLVDVSDPNYNPSALSEADAQFDTRYDDMLIARIRVDANGLAVIESLKNKAILFLNIKEQVIMPVGTGVTENQQVVINGNAYDLYWSRTPRYISSTLNVSTAAGISSHIIDINNVSIDRYSVTFGQLHWQNLTSITYTSDISAELCHQFSA